MSTHSSKERREAVKDVQPPRVTQPRKAKTKKDYEAVATGKSTKGKTRQPRHPLRQLQVEEDAVSILPSENGDFESDVSQANMTDSSHDSESHDDGSSASDQSDQEEIQRLKEMEEEGRRLEKLQKDSHSRVKKLEKRVQDKQKADKERKTRRKSQEYQARIKRKERIKKLEEENEARLRKIEELTRLEDHLSEVITGDKSPAPKTAGECRQLLNSMVSFNAGNKKSGKRSGVYDIAATVAKMAGLNTNTGMFHCGESNTNTESKFESVTGAQSVRSSASASSKGSSKVARKRSRSPIQESTETESDSADEHDKASRRKKGKKLQNGKTAKFDDTDIRRVVRYPHSKLNLEFTDHKKFEELELNLFVAGELEIISRSKGHEHDSRIKLLTIIMYHSQCCRWPVLRQQYDMLMKRIEREEIEWDHDLSQAFDKAIERRLRMGNAGEREQKIKNVKAPKAGNQNSKSTKGDETFYCLDYNKGKCDEPAAHMGRLGNREVLKQHICRRCWQEKAQKVGHTEQDPRCPFKQ